MGDFWGPAGIISDLFLRDFSGEGALPSKEGPKAMGGPPARSILSVIALLLCLLPCGRVMDGRELSAVTRGPHIYRSGPTQVVPCDPSAALRAEGYELMAGDEISAGVRRRQGQSGRGTAVGRPVRGGRDADAVRVDGSRYASSGEQGPLPCTPKARGARYNGGSSFTAGF